MRSLGLALCLTMCACRGGASVPTTAPSELRVAVEGNCSKLQVDEAGQQTMLVLGTYGLDEASAWSGAQTAHAAQALAFVRERTATIEPGLLTGLPLSSHGWIDGDVRVGGSGVSALWLERVVRTPASIDKGALFEVARDEYSWTGHEWRSSLGRDSLSRGPHTTLPVAAMFCDERGFSLLASERAPDGTTFVAGRCEDDLHRPSGGLGLARYDIRTRQWRRVTTPGADLFNGPDAIVNAGIVIVSPDEAFVHAYRPFHDSREAHERGYVLHVQGAVVTPIAFEGEAVSLSRGSDGTLWAIAGFSELRRMSADGRWMTVSLPPLAFVEPVPTQIRLLEVHTTAHDVWVHGAVPTVRADGRAGREHVLFTSAPWTETLHCDREKAPLAALGPSREKARLAVVHEHEKRAVE
jgi:hypothetical protein